MVLKKLSSMFQYVYIYIYIHVYMTTSISKKE